MVDSLGRQQNMVVQVDISITCDERLGGGWGRIYSRLLSLPCPLALMQPNVGEGPQRSGDFSQES